MTTAIIKRVYDNSVSSPDEIRTILQSIPDNCWEIAFPALMQHGENIKAELVPARSFTISDEDFRLVRYGEWRLAGLKQDLVLEEIRRRQRRE